MGTGSSSPTRQPVLPRPLILACESAMKMADADRQAAAVLVHSGAIVQHAQQVGLVDPTLGTRAALDVLAELHPGLEPLAVLTPAPSARAARAVAELWSRHRLHDENTLWWSYPLGDLYQTLSTEAVKTRALCQTPWWVTRLLIEISYDEAQDEFADPRVIDPACGTGHILIEALDRAAAPHRVWDGYSAARPYRHYQPDMVSALDRVHGVELDPWAAAVARYRLITRAWAHLRQRAATPKIADLPVHVAAADSLLTESADEPLLARDRYHVALANPPYITVKDPVANAAIRARYRQVCSGKYSLALPFHALMHELLVPGGWCAQLTAASFSKREFGKAYIERWLPQFDLRWVIDTSGVYIPGHGTPTMILCTRNAPPAGPTVHSVLGNRGEPSRPDEPSQGRVWTAIEDAVHSVLARDRLNRGADPARGLGAVPEASGTVSAAPDHDDGDPESGAAA